MKNDYKVTDKRLMNKEPDQKGATQSSEDSELLTRAKKNIASWYTCWQPNNERFVDDIEFALGDQWRSNDLSDQARLQQTSLVFNKVYEYGRRFVGQFMESTPALEVRVLNGQPNQSEITLRANITRGIYYNSNAKLTFQNCLKNSFFGGYGAYRIYTDYENERSSKQTIRIGLIDDPRKAFFDPSAKELHKGDGSFGGFYESFSRDEFKQNYPDASFVFDTFGAPDDIFDWGDNEKYITVANYYEVKNNPTTLYETAAGDFLKEDYDKLEQGIFGKPPILSERKTNIPEIHAYKITAVDVLEKTIWPSRYLPVIYVDGDSHSMAGHQTTYSFVSQAKDPQRFYNYVVTQIADSLKKGRREQWLGTPENIPPQLRRYWTNPESRQGLLLADYDSHGNLPTKQTPDEVSVSLLQLHARAETDIQSTLGMFSSARGQDGSAESGKAIFNQVTQSNASTSVYIQNLINSMEQGGRVINDLMPKVYDTERYVGILDESNKGSSVLINQQTPLDTPKNQISDGEYEICIDAGPSFALQKELGLKLLLELVSAQPNTFPLLADLIAQNLDLENMPQIVSRLRNLVPPEIIAKEEGKEPPPPQPDPMQQFMRANLQLKQKEIEQKGQEIQIDSAKLYLSAEQEKMKYEATMAKAQAEMHKAQLDQYNHILTTLAKLAQANQSKFSAEKIRGGLRQP